VAAKAMLVDPPSKVKGVVLSGGLSQRMRTDKAALIKNGRSWLAHQVDLLESVGLETFVSIRADQSNDPVRKPYKTIPDVGDVKGPAAGILAAFAADPRCAWLVVAVDLPHLKAETVQFLLNHRDPSRVASAFCSQHDSMPEPLCAIYEPSARDALTQFLAQGYHCPRKFLIHHSVTLLTQPYEGHLDNINTPEEWHLHRNSVA
jgi:molybdopterin-guanine dinucleotide biosynthesis protein A